MSTQYLALDSPERVQIDSRWEAQRTGVKQWEEDRLTLRLESLVRIGVL